MAKNPDADLFTGSTMSIGDHLEELRIALFRSVIGLMIGFGLGLLVANWVVEWIKSPLASSLERYYIDKSIDQMKAENGEESIPKSLEYFIRSHRLVFEKHYLELDELARMQRLRDEYFQEHPEQPAKSKPAVEEPPPPDSTTVRLTSTETKAEAEPGSEPAVEEVAPSIVGGEKLPPPGSTLLVTRVWKPIQSVVKALNAQEVFMIWMKAGLVVGVVISSPYVFLQIWNFVAAGLYPHEKRYVHMYLPFSLGLFLSGAALCFYFVIPQVLDWLLTFNKQLNIDPDPRISEWLGFVLFLPLGFGISFQLPLVMLLLNRIGVLSVELYLAKWRIAVLVIFVISMVLTPADPVSMLFMAVPLTFLYFGGIGLCKWMPRGKNPFDAAYEP